MGLRHASPTCELLQVNGGSEQQHSVMQLAARLEPDGLKRQCWYCNQPISAMGGLTAQQAIESGMGPQLMYILSSWLKNDFESHAPSRFSQSFIFNS